MAGPYTITPSDQTALGTLIHLHGRVLLITGISSDSAAQHNRLAELMVGVLARLTLAEQAELEAIVGAHETRWTQETPAQ
ncbi:hypothetical protein SAMN02982917_2322 [Azospirillum oryzae]|uniref:Uncharacterized protein n=1 Tax=Azospirillum oryzae TaxID=286727 RepID=A0A1X7F7U6_9PROT|nr:hypothetical protein [Azospirillum oryzae]SMF47481.1 hypothetical protein SAMN02982917_2322 [Azospirillum oryzae]